MTEHELIAKQAMQIAEMQKQLDEYATSFDAIHGYLYGIGAPLNDNLLQFTPAQLKVFRLIARELTT